MAVDQDKELDLEDLEIDLEDPGSGQPRDSALVEDDLEQYGVWVKVEPREVDEATRPAPEEPHLENLDRPGGDDEGLTEEEEELLGSLEESSVATQPELEDIGDLGDLSIPEEEDLGGLEPETEQVDVLLSEEPEASDTFDAIDVLDGEPSEAPTARSATATAERGHVLQKIEEELAAIRGELAALKSELVNLRHPAADTAARPDEPEREAGFFADDSDETIALTGDELDNILNTAEITEEEAADGAGIDELGEMTVLTEPEPEQASSDLEVISLDEPIDETPAEMETITLDEPLDLEPMTLAEPAEELELEPAESAELETISFEEPAETPELESIVLDEPVEAEALSLGGSAEPAIEMPVFDEPEEPVAPALDLELPDVEEIGLDALDTVADLTDEEPAAEGPLEALEELEIELDEEPPASAAEALPEDVEEIALPEPDEELILEAPEEIKEMEPFEAEISFDVPELEAPAEEAMEPEGSELTLDIPAEEIADAAGDEEMLEPAEDLEEVEAFEEAGPTEHKPPAMAAAAELVRRGAAEASSTGGVIPPALRDEIRTVLKYMDQLLEALPDAKIKEFAESEYFEVYKRLFEELEIA